MKCKNCGRDEEYHGHDTNRCPSDWLGGLWADTTFEPSYVESESEKLGTKVNELPLKIAELEKRILYLENVASRLGNIAKN